MPYEQQTELPNDALAPLSWVLLMTGLSQSALYELMAERRFVPPVKIGRRAARWPVYEVRSCIRGLISGRDQHEMQALVAQLLDERKALRG